MSKSILIPNNPTIAEFDNIPYLWRGHNPSVGLDCFTLHNYITYRWEKRIIEGFEWVMDKYTTEVDSPQDLVQKEFYKKFGKEPNGLGMSLEIVLLDWYGRFGIGTILFHQGVKYIVHTGRGSSSYTPMERLTGRIRGCWNTRPWTKQVDNFYGLKI